MAPPPRQQHNATWRALASRGFGDLSPPEAEHAILELPTNRAEYIAMLEAVGDYPARSPIGERVPTERDIAALRRAAGRWRAVVLLEDERALKTSAWLFHRVFVLDPFYDNGAQLYAAWHDPLIKDDHARRLAQETGLLVRAAPLLNAGTAVLTPDHLPGSWSPRPGWRRPRATEDRRQLAAWSVRKALVLAYWADRLDAVICATGPHVVASMDVLLGDAVRAVDVRVHEPRAFDDVQAAREARADELAELWGDLRTVSRRRDRYCLEDVAFILSGQEGPSMSAWRFVLGETSLPDPPMLVRRVLNGQDPQREPRLPPKRLRRRPLCLLEG